MKFIISILAVFAAFLAQSGAFSVRNGMRMSLTGNCLIVQNKGGGHGTIGYYLCNELLAKNPDLKISMLQDKCNYKKVPFSLYDELKDKGVEIIDTDMSTNPDVGGKKFDYVVDNWSKGAEAASYMINLVKSCEAKQYVFVSSAGMYKSNDGTPLTESDDVKVNVHHNE
jgi:nucleoside-diphosphate-sugar epimerase